MSQTQANHGSRANVLIAGLDDQTAAWLRDCISAVANPIQCQTLPQVAYYVDQGSAAAVVTQATPAGQANPVLEAVGGRVPVLVVATSAEATDPDDERVFFVLSRRLPPADVAALVHSAVVERAQGGTEINSPAEAALVQRVLEMAGRFANRRDLSGAADVAEQAVIEFARADRAYCLFHDADGGALWTEGDNEREGQATSGLAGFAARTGRPLSVNQAADDPRYMAQLDDPEGTGKERLLVVPLAEPNGQVHAVLVAVRLASRAPFSDAERGYLWLFAEKCAPMMQHLALMVETEGVLRAQREGGDGLFRAEAVREYGESGQRGDVVRVSPNWVAWAYWVLVGLSIASVVFLIFGEVDQYSAGPAIIRLNGRTEVVAQQTGALVSVEVQPGQQVKAGDMLARLDNTQALAERARIGREFNAQLRKRMLDPSDQAATQAVISLRGQHDAARANLEQRDIRAPRDGRVSDLRIRSGQHIGMGEIVMSLLDNEDDRQVVAILPGGDLPQFHPGMPMRIEIKGYKYAYQDLKIDSVSDEVIGPNEARRYLGPTVGDGFQLNGPVVFARAKLPDGTFVADNETYQYHEGMQATAEVRIRSEPIIVTLFPFLKRI